VHEAKFITPLWFRQTIHEANLIPVPELREHIRKEAALLPQVLSGQDGGAQAQRKALLTMDCLCERLTPKRRMTWIDDVSVRDLRTAIRAEAAALPAVLDRASEVACQRKLARMSSLCRHLLGLMLTLILIGGCPICEICPICQMLPWHDHFEHATRE
jgi:hypothetical protein